MRIKIVAISIGIFALTSCAGSSNQTVSTMSLCDQTLNFSGGLAYQRAHNARVDELNRRGEDCSNYMHLRRPVPPQQSINVNNQN
jgi:hypothetical protein